MVAEIKELHRIGRPVLVGTISIEKSEILSKYLTKEGIKHHVLNAKHHEMEAEIIAQAGQMGVVTISTNMAGRGTDIKLGHSVADVGGLHVLGTERHESRRIDNQLRGRSGRQGDKGSSRFYLSLDDDLLRIFGADHISSVMDRIGFEEGQPIEHNLISKAIENAQKRVEGQNFDMRKHLLEYDDVMNQQRQIIYSQRKEVLSGEDLWSYLEDIIEEVVDSLLDNIVDEKTHPEDWNLKDLDDQVYKQFSLILNLKGLSLDDMDKERLRELILAGVTGHLRTKEETIGKPVMDYLLRFIMIQSIDSHWKDHLLSMDHLKEGIGLRGYGQKDPKREYQREGYEMFLDMVQRIKEDSVEKLCIVQIQRQEELPESHTALKRNENYVMSHGSGQTEEKTVVKRESQKVGRNDPCPCGSGRKYKKCCGK